MTNENRGMDVGGFFAQLHYMFYRNYTQYYGLYKFQCKRNLIWRRSLLLPLTYLKEIIKNHQKLLDSYGYISSNVWLLNVKNMLMNQDKIENYLKKKHISIPNLFYKVVDWNLKNKLPLDAEFYVDFHDDLKKAYQLLRFQKNITKKQFGIFHWNCCGKYEKKRITNPRMLLNYKYLNNKKEEDIYKFTGGTIFFTRFDYIKILYNKYIEPFDKKLLEIGYFTNANSSKYTHMWEQLFGILAKYHGYTYYGQKMYCYTNKRKYDFFIENMNKTINDIIQIYIYKKMYCDKYIY